MRVDLESYRRLTELADYIVPFTLRAVSQLGVADLLADGPMPVEALAAATSTHAPSLHRALRALAAKGIFAEPEPGVFTLTPLAEPLRGDHPLSLRDAYPLLASDVDAWGALDHSVRTGEAAFDHVHGTDYWTWLRRHPDDSARVDASMAAVNALHLRTVLGAVGWAELATVVDVGGGDGSFLAGVLRRFPHLRGTLVDLPQVAGRAADVAAAAGVTGRLAVAAGSFFDPLPGGADAYLLKTVLPGFADAAAERVLHRVREAVPPAGRVLLLEAVIAPGNGYDAAKLVDVHTLMLTGSAHRTEEELTALLARAAFEVCSVRRTASLSVIEARPVRPAPHTLR